MLIGLARCERDQRDGPVDAPQLCAQLGAVDVTEEQVEQRDVDRADKLRIENTLRNGLGRNHVKVRLGAQPHRQRLQEDAVVIDEKDADRVHEAIVAGYVGHAQMQMTRLGYVICTWVSTVNLVV
jgi:hypothetical protein